MIRVQEDELKSILKRFENISIKIVLDGALSGEFIINKAIYNCETRNGKMTIIDKDNTNFLTINILPMYEILRDENFTTLQLFMEYDLEIIIEKI